MSLTIEEREEREECLVELTEFMKDRRAPPNLLDRVNLRYRIDRQTIMPFEVRSAWDDITEVIGRPFAKFTLVRTRAMWTLYWMRASGRWHFYEPTE
jgi:hypothetical protein